MIQQPPSSSPPVPAPTVDPRRPFGAHVRMSWWKPLLIVIVPLLVMIIAQYALMIIAVIVEIVAFGRDPYATAMTPLMMLAGNLSLTLMGPLAILLTAWLAKVPWRSLLSFPRGLSGARWGVYGAAFTGLVVIGLLLTWLLFPDAPGMELGSITLAGGSITLLAVVLLTTPLQAASEELALRGAMMPAIASWVKPGKAAAAVGAVLSSLIFGAIHGSIDPWLASYYTIFGASMAVMVILSRGLEAPIMFHVMNNVILLTLTALTGGGDVDLDRSVGSGGPFMLVFIAIDVLAVLVVWLYERRGR